MAMPEIDGCEVLELHDYGGCGQVFRSRDESGKLVALKLFEDLSVNRSLLAKMSQRLHVDGWPNGVLPILSKNLERSPLYQVMPWLADEVDGRWRPRSLQHRIDDFPETDAWEIIRELATAISHMHQRHVPHGNLKPGNIFIDDEGRILVSDWCLGNMPGVHVFHFTDALLYQPPEQLHDSSGYLDEQGYGWDVYAFGVIAYRLLTGCFPRCDDVFRKVAPKQGVTHCEGLKADPDKVAAKLEASAVMDWPTPARDRLEERLREWIIKCLQIDPAKRPLGMVEVCGGFELIEREEAIESERQRLLLLNKKVERRASTLMLMLGAGVVAILVLTSLWRLAESRITDQEAVISEERATLKAAADGARNAEQAARKAELEAKNILAEERQHNLERLEASRMIGDGLFAWAMEKDRRQLPPLDGRELRLKRLERYFQEFLDESRGKPALQDEVARVKLQLAEISIAKGNVKEAVERFAAARESISVIEMDTEWRLRLATDSLLIAKMLEGRSDGMEAMRAFSVAREALRDVPREEADVDRLDQLSAVLDYREAKLRAQRGEESQALEQLMRATETLNRISQQRPDVAILHSALADCYLSSAGILEAMGSLGDAREVRLLAVKELQQLRKAKPEDLKVLFDLAACCSAMADAAALSGDLNGARQRSEEGLGLLKAYLSQRPRDDEAMVMRAGLMGLQAGLLRDQGKAADSIKTYDEALKILVAVHHRKPDHAMASYRLALIWWQKGRMLGMNGNSTEEVQLLSRAATLLSVLAKSKDGAGPRKEQLKRSRAYLAGDLGHTHDLNGDKTKARAALTHAAELWTELRELRPKSEEYLQALSWCEERLEELK